MTISKELQKKLKGFKSLAMKHQGYHPVMVFNGTFNNISIISWRSVLLVEETGVP
jgi:hypothetical protein